MVITCKMCLNTWGCMDLNYTPKKCNFFQSQIKYLSHRIYAGNLGVQKTKMNVMSKVPKQTNVSWLRAFLGLANYYQ
jgi:hypothetical protein